MPRARNSAAASSNGEGGSISMHRLFCARGFAEIPEHVTADRDGKRQCGRLRFGNQGAELVQRHPLAAADLGKGAPCESIQAEAGAARANANVVTDKPVA